ncbi:MAG: putative sulfate exporter family transporter, partial [Planctomycetota bacterium]
MSQPDSLDSSSSNPYRSPVDSDDVGAACLLADSPPSTTEPGEPSVGGSEDLLAIVIAWSVLLIGLVSVVAGSALGESDQTVSLLKGFVAKPGAWTNSPLEAFVPQPKDGNAVAAIWPGVLGAFVMVSALFGSAALVRKQNLGKFLKAVAAVFVLATLAYVLAGQKLVKAYNLEYALWALAVGLVISNTIRTPAWLRPAVQTEFFIKAGLVLLGAEILMSRLLTLGVPGIFVAWVVTPIVLITTYWFGQRVLKIGSP